MGVLAAVLANARRIALDVAGIERSLVERRGKQQRQLVLRPDQSALHRRHGPHRTRWLGGAGDRCPGLRNRVDSALVIGCRAERRAIVEPGAAVPNAIPSLS